MVIQSILAYLHYLSFLLVISSLVTESFVIEQTLTARSRKILQKADGLYGLAAILVLITGFIRIYYTGKGPDYYFGNTYFLTKLGTFILVGLLSIYPTVVFLKWRKITTTDTVTLEKKQFRNLRILIRMEVFLVFLIPLFAALMARGLG